MNLFKSMNISASALTAQRFRMDIIAENMANMTTTRTADGTPYRRKYTVMEERKNPDLFANLLNDAKGRLSFNYGNGVKAVSVGEDQGPLRMVYDPQHPDADEGGYVSLPNVDIVQEMVDMISATRSYEANVTVINSYKNMAMRGLDIGR